MRTRTSLGWTLLCVACVSEPPDAAPAGRPPVPAVMAAHQRTAAGHFSGERARDVVAFVERWFRLPGNAGFDASIGRVVEELEAAGYREESAAAAPLTYRIERRPLERPAWEPVSGSLRVVGDPAPLLSYETHRNLIAIRSRPTPPGGVEAEVVYVGAGREADFEGVDVRGRIALGDAPVGRLFEEAVRKRGALGVLAYRIPALNRPEEHPDVIPFSSLPFDPEAGSWGLLLSRAARDELHRRLSADELRVRVEIETRSYDAEELTLVAEVHGGATPRERFVFSAHVQEPGANDNASGVGALAEIARVLAAGVHDGTFAPLRTITMIWGDEILSTRRYLEEDTARARDVRWGLSLDMVGEDTDKTGGTFLIEKMPDPSAVWTRGEDRHTEWGGEPMSPDELVPHWFNDFALNRCLDRAASNGWVVRTNPFEGGSDHVPFLRAGVPALLFWHFTDVYYHTDGDRLDKVSAAELANVGVCASVVAMTLAAADAEVAAFMVGEVERAAIERLAREEALSRAAVAGGSGVEAEREILRAWTAWYDGALAALADVEVGGAGAATRALIEGARARVAAEGAAAAERIR